MSRKFSTLIHFVPSELSPSGRYAASQLTHDSHGLGGLLLAPSVVLEPQPKLLVQGRVLRHGPLSRGFNQILVGAQGNFFHVHLGIAKLTRV